MGTFSQGMHGQPGTLDGVRRRLPYLRELGIGAIQLMPPFEFAGDRSWGYNPAFPYAVESTYGGPDELKQLVRAAHEHGIAVILDVVYNHLGPVRPGPVAVRRLVARATRAASTSTRTSARRTPWGETRPDYGRPEVREFLRDNVLQWLDEFRVDGLRWDATAYISSITGGGHTAADVIEDGWELMAAINGEMAERLPGPADHRRGPQGRRRRSPRRRTEGGAGFGAQWDGGFVHPVRAALTATADEERDMAAVAAAIGVDAGGRLQAGHLHRVPRRGCQRQRPRARGDLAGLRRQLGVARSGPRWARRWC